MQLIHSLLCYAKYASKFFSKPIMTSERNSDINSYSRIWQMTPLIPEGHVHEKEPEPETHVPPFKHGCGAHKSSLAVKID